MIAKEVRSAGYLRTAVLIITVVLAVGGHGWAADDNAFAQSVSDSIVPFLVVGEISLMTDGEAGKAEALQGAKAVIATLGVTELLKSAIREERPNEEDMKSFPSMHTSLAFAMATVVAEYEPERSGLAYGIAAAIGWSRVEVEAHHWHDVLVGAALGHFIAKRYTDQKLVITPNGVAYNWKW